MVSLAQSDSKAEDQQLSAERYIAAALSRNATQMWSHYRIEENSERAIEKIHQLTTASHSEHTNSHSDVEEEGHSETESFQSKRLPDITQQQVVKQTHAHQTQLFEIPGQKSLEEFGREAVSEKCKKEVREVNPRITENAPMEKRQEIENSQEGWVGVSCGHHQEQTTPPVGEEGEKRAPESDHVAKPEIKDVPSLAELASDDRETGPKKEEDSSSDSDLEFLTPPSSPIPRHTCPIPQPIEDNSINTEEVGLTLVSGITPPTATPLHSEPRDISSPTATHPVKLVIDTPTLTNLSPLWSEEVNGESPVVTDHPHEKESSRLSPSTPSHTDDQTYPASLSPSEEMDDQALLTHPSQPKRDVGSMPPHHHPQPGMDNADVISLADASQPDTPTSHVAADLDKPDMDKIDLRLHPSKLHQDPHEPEDEIEAIALPRDQFEFAHDEFDGHCKVDREVNTEPPELIDQAVNTHVIELRQQSMNTDQVETRHSSTNTEIEVDEKFACTDRVETSDVAVLAKPIMEEKVMNTELSAFELLKRVHSTEKLERLEAASKTMAAELNEEKSKRMVGDRLVQMMQSELTELRQSNATEMTSRLRQENELTSLKVGRSCVFPTDHMIFT